MLGSSTSNIYVSVTGPKDNDHGSGYRRPEHTWMISVESHHIGVVGMPHKQKEPIHYAASRNMETGVYTINTHEISAGPGIIGNILIAESANVSAEKIHEILEEEIGPSSPPAASSKPSSKGSDPSGEEPEDWIRKAIQGFQKRKVAEPFDVEEFMMFAHGYTANRVENETPALIAYPKIHKDAEKKSSKHKFWISTPMAGRTKTNTNGEALKYGGLM